MHAHAHAHCCTHTRTRIDARTRAPALMHAHCALMHAHAHEVARAHPYKCTHTHAHIPNSHRSSAFQDNEPKVRTRCILRNHRRFLVCRLFDVIFQDLRHARRSRQRHQLQRGGSVCNPTAVQAPRNDGKAASFLFGGNLVAVVEQLLLQCNWPGQPQLLLRNEIATILLLDLADPIPTSPSAVPLAAYSASAV
jgi:hypothetical protein